MGMGITIQEITSLLIKIIPLLKRVNSIVIDLISITLAWISCRRLKETMVDIYKLVALHLGK